jgi:anti-anti-sigma factor
MNVKIDTKEIFHVINVMDSSLTANMTDELSDCLLPILQQEIKNVILKLTEVQLIEETTAETIVKIQQRFYENKSSFVVCELNDAVEKFLDETNLLELMNVTPTESEAWDIVQMEEIERELMGDDDI